MLCNDLRLEVLTNEMQVGIPCMCQNLSLLSPFIDINFITFCKFKYLYCHVMNFDTYQGGQENT